MEIKISYFFRILGIAVCLCFLIAIPFMFFGENTIDKDQGIFFIISSAFFIPIVFSCCVLGKIPDFITKHLDEESLKDLNEAEKLFTEFNPKSVGFAIALLSMVAYTIFINN